jgi:hypothetical protein
MDLQEIKKEIESLKKDTSYSKSVSEKSHILGFTHLRLLLTAVLSGVLLYVSKPIYIFNFSYNNETKTVERKISYLRTSIAFAVCFLVLVGLQKIPVQI